MRFWADYARYLLTRDRGPFMTANFTEMAKDYRDHLFTIALLDLPVENNKEHKQELNDQQGMTIHAQTNLILFKKQIKKAKKNL